VSSPVVVVVVPPGLEPLGASLLKTLKGTLLPVPTPEDEEGVLPNDELAPVEPPDELKLELAPLEDEPSV
jgi:hypothetical protein